MKIWQKYLFAIIAVGFLIYNLYIGISSDFWGGYSTIISMTLFSVLALSKFTKHPL